MTRKHTPPTPEQIAEIQASAEHQFGLKLGELIFASASEIEDSECVAIILRQTLIQFIMTHATHDGEPLTFAEAGKEAIRILKNAIKRAKYRVSRSGELFDIETGKEVSPGGLKQ